MLLDMCAAPQHRPFRIQGTGSPENLLLAGAQPGTCLSARITTTRQPYVKRGLNELEIFRTTLYDSRQFHQPFIFLRPSVESSPNIILIKTSSMGDVLHNLPVVTDILHHFPVAKIDWVVEGNFAALPALHPGIRQVVPVAVRRWRKSWWRARREIRASCQALRTSHYDFAVDTQGLLKSALITRCINAARCGLDWKSTREPLASLLYDRTFFVEKNQHAVERNRQLVAQALGYSLDSAADYGIIAPDVTLTWCPDAPYAVLLHATSRDDKLWDEHNWIELGRHLSDAGLCAILPWGSALERKRSERLSAAISNAICAPHIDLRDAAALLGRARVVIGVDTGMSHLAAALGVPTIGIYTATDPGLTGLYAGSKVVNLGGAGSPPDVDTVLAELALIGTYG
jgi:lipopolysaccharide heptosyltransferase I